MNWRNCSDAKVSLFLTYSWWCFLNLYKLNGAFIPSILYFNGNSSLSFIFLSKEVAYFLGRISFLSIINKMSSFSVFFGGEDHLCFSRNSNILLKGKTILFLPSTQKISYIYVFFEKDHSFIFYLKRNIMFSGKRKTFLIIQEISYYSVICFGDTIFSEHLEKIWFLVQCRVM